MSKKKPNPDDLPSVDEAAHHARDAALRFNGLAALPSEVRDALTKLHTSPLAAAHAALAAWRVASLAEAAERDFKKQAVEEAGETIAALLAALKVLKALERHAMGPHRRAALAAFRAGRPMSPVDTLPARRALEDALRGAEVERGALGGRGRPVSRLHHFADALLPIWSDGGLAPAAEPVAAFANFIAIAAEIATSTRPGKALALRIAREIAPRPN